jgi:AAHS family 4-hydroxybenzoate transporter-like MFS transporter
MMIDVTRLLDANRLSPRIVGWSGLLTAVLIMDGFDLVALGLLAPSVAREFGLSRVALGWILTGNGLGVALGGLLGGLAGDAIGRKKAIALSIALFGIGTLLCALASAPALFVCARCVAGIGMGAATPNIGAWLVETLPGKWTSRLTTFAFSTSTVGSTLCAITASFLLPIAGWRSVFMVGGVAPLLLLPLLVLLLPNRPSI